MLPVDEQDETARLYDARECAEWTAYERLAERRAALRAVERFGIALDVAAVARHGSAALALHRRLHKVNEQCLAALEAVADADKELRRQRGEHD